MKVYLNKFVSARNKMLIGTNSVGASVARLARNAKWDTKVDGQMLIELYEKSEDGKINLLGTVRHGRVYWRE